MNDDKTECEQLRSELAQVRSELDQMTKERDTAKRSTYDGTWKISYKATEDSLARRGLKMGQLQWKWRNEPIPDWDCSTATDAVLDALNREGVAAWSGDGVGCVVDMLYTQYKRFQQVKAERDAARKVAEELRAALEEACVDLCEFCASVGGKWQGFIVEASVPQIDGWYHDLTGHGSYDGDPVECKAEHLRTALSRAQQEGA